MHHLCCGLGWNEQFLTGRVKLSRRCQRFVRFSFPVAVPSPRSRPAPRQCHIISFILTEQQTQNVLLLQLNPWTVRCLQKNQLIRPQLEQKFFWANWNSVLRFDPKTTKRQKAQLKRFFSVATRWYNMCTQRVWLTARINSVSKSAWRKSDMTCSQFRLPYNSHWRRLHEDPWMCFITRAFYSELWYFTFTKMSKILVTFVRFINTGGIKLTTL